MKIAIENIVGRAGLSGGFVCSFEIMQTVYDCIGVYRSNSIANSDYNYIQHLETMHFDQPQSVNMINSI